MNDKNIQVEFGLRIRKARIEQNLSQERLGEMAGLHRTYIGMIERGEKNITITNVEKLSIALNLSLETIFKDL